MEPPLRTLRDTLSLYKGHLFQYFSVLFDLRDWDDLSTRDEIVGPYSVPCSEVPLFILYIPHVEWAVWKSNPDHRFPLHVHKADIHVLVSVSCSHGLVPSVGDINFGQCSAK